MDKTACIRGINGDLKALSKLLVIQNYFLYVNNAIRTNIHWSLLCARLVQGILPACIIFIASSTHYNLTRWKWQTLVCCSPVQWPFFSQVHSPSLAFLRLGAAMWQWNIYGNHVHHLLTWHTKCLLLSPLSFLSSFICLLDPMEVSQDPGDYTY